MLSQEDHKNLSEEFYRATTFLIIQEASYGMPRGQLTNLLEDLEATIERLIYKDNNADTSHKSALK